MLAYSSSAPLGSMNSNAPATFSVPFAPMHGAPANMQTVSPSSPYPLYVSHAPVFPLSSSASAATVAAAAALIHQPTPVYHPSFPSSNASGTAALHASTVMPALTAGSPVQQSPISSMPNAAAAAGVLTPSSSLHSAASPYYPEHGQLFSLPTWPSASAAAAITSSAAALSSASQASASAPSAQSASLSPGQQYFPSGSAGGDASSGAVSPRPKRKKSKNGEKVQRKVACMLCHQAKTVCIGGRPCQRCKRLHKSEHCVDRSTSVKKSRGDGDGDDGEDGDSLATGDGKDSKPKPFATMTPLGSLSSSSASIPSASEELTVAGEEWATILPSLYTSSFFSAMLHPERAYPSISVQTASKTAVHVLSHFNEIMPKQFFLELLKEMGYRQITQPAAASRDDKDSEERREAGGGGGGGRAAGSTEPVVEIEDEEHAERRSFWRSVHPHIPDLILPLQRRFNWTSSPNTALREQTVTTRLPALIIARGDVVLPEPPQQQQPPPSADGKPALPCVPASSSSSPFPAPLRALINDIDLPVTVQVNVEFEHVFGYTQQELKLLFLHRGRRALDRLTMGTDKRVGTLSVKSSVDGVTELADTVTISSKYGNQIRAMEHRKITLDEIAWFKKVVFTWVPFSKA